MGYPPGTPNASTYRFFTTNVITGRVMSDALPIIGTSAQAMINSVGTFTGSLALTDDYWAQNAAQGGGGNPGFQSNRQVADWVHAVEPWKNILWILQDDHPIWNGPIIGWDPTSALSGSLPLQASTMEEMFKHRLISKLLKFVNVDVFDIFRAEQAYALGKDLPFSNIAGTGRYADRSGFVDTVDLSGITASITEFHTFKAIYDAWTDLVQNFGLEFNLAPRKADSDSFYTHARLGLPLLGSKQADTGLTIVFPSRGVLDYAWQAIATAPANVIWVTGNGAGNRPKFFISQPPHGRATKEFNAGYPLLEDSFGISGVVTSQRQVNLLADGLLFGTTVSSSLTPIFTVGPQAERLRVRDIQLGDEVAVAVSSPLHPVDPSTGAPRVRAKFRIASWTLNFPNASQDEQVQLQLGAGTAAELEGGLTGGVINFGGFGFGGFQG